MKIEIDNDVFEFLQKRAVPFVDNPNSVLRRLLLHEKTGSEDQKEAQMPTEKLYSIFKPKSSDVITDMPLKSLQDREDKNGFADFISFILKEEFKEEFHKKASYRMMFESSGYLVYMQNFNKESDRMWFSIMEKPLAELKKTEKKAFICLTNPAKHIAYMIPVKDIEEQIRKSGWSRNHLTANINHRSSRWIELNWNIKDYLKQYGMW